MNTFVTKKKKKIEYHWVERRIGITYPTGFPLAKLSEIEIRSGDGGGCLPYFVDKSIVENHIYTTISSEMNSSIAKKIIVKQEFARSIQMAPSKCCRICAPKQSHTWGWGLLKGFGVWILFQELRFESHHQWRIRCIEPWRVWCWSHYKIKIYFISYYLLENQSYRVGIMFTFCKSFYSTMNCIAHKQMSECMELKIDRLYIRVHILEKFMIATVFYFIDMYCCFSYQINFLTIWFTTENNYVPRIVNFLVWIFIYQTIKKLI